MRKRWLWLSVSLILLVGAFLAVSFLTPAPPPYSFLDGLNATHVRYGSRPGDQREHTLYSVKTDFNAFIRRAEKELKPKGFNVVHFKENSNGPLGMVYLSKRGVKARVMDSVDILVYRNMRHSVNGMGSVPAAGWVLITLIRSPQETPFDRLKDWLGI
jgi:hypothetical protein